MTIQTCRICRTQEHALRAEFRVNAITAIKQGYFSLQIASRCKICTSYIDRASRQVQKS